MRMRYQTTKGCLITLTSGKIFWITTSLKYMLPEGYTLPPPSPYTYSDPVVIRKWKGGSLVVKVGYVRDHPEKNQVVLEKVISGQLKPELFYIRDYNIKPK